MCRRARRRRAIFSNGHADEATFTFGPPQWRLSGIGKNLSFESLRVQFRVLVQNAVGEASAGESYNYHLDTLDLCNAKHRQGFIAAAQGETRWTRTCSRDLGQVLLEGRGVAREAHPPVRRTTEEEVTVADGERRICAVTLRESSLAGPHPGGL